MTHITEARVIGNHADMGASPPAAARRSLTVTEILRAGVRRRAERTEMDVAQSVWDAEGGASEESELPRGGTEGLPDAPHATTRAADPAPRRR